MNTELMHIDAELTRLHGTKWRQQENGQHVNRSFDYTVIGHEHTFKNYGGTSYPYKIYVHCKNEDGREVSFLYEDLLKLVML